MIEGAQYVDGRVAIRYHQPIPKQINVGGQVYVTDVRYGVALVLADEADATRLLAHLGGCCGGQKKVFALATETAVKVWRDGHY